MAESASHATHWTLICCCCWCRSSAAGISLYGARDVFGLFSIPPLAAQNQAAAEGMLLLHKYLAYLTVAVVGAHVGGALFHYFIRKDSVLMRMLPWAGRRD